MVFCFGNVAPLRSRRCHRRSQDSTLCGFFRSRAGKGKVGNILPNFKINRSLSPTPISEHKVYVIAFVYVLNPEDCESLIFSGSAAHQLSDHGLVEKLEEWDGKSSLYVRDDVWLQTMAILLAGSSQNIWDFPWSRVCLVSDRGLSVCLPTFAISYPEYISSRRIIH